MITAIVLAAGHSRRMGTQKLLLPFHGEPIISRVVGELQNSGVDQILVVINQAGSGIVRALAEHHVQFVTNEQSAGEMLTSVRAGLRAMSEQSTAALVALGDQPSISAGVIRRLIKAFQTGKFRIVVPAYQGKRGHPLLISDQYRDEVLAQHDGAGLRGLLETHPQDVLELDVPAPEILEDIDLPEDYLRAIRHHGDT